MASYKILFLDFCYKNEPRRKVKTTFALQNASNQGQFVNYDDNGVSLASQAIHPRPWNNDNSGGRQSHNAKGRLLYTAA
jgi:hypothetical protein